MRGCLSRPSVSFSFWDAFSILAAIPNLFVLVRAGDRLKIYELQPTDKRWMGLNAVGWEETPPLAHSEIGAVAQCRRARRCHSLHIKQCLRFSLLVPEAALHQLRIRILVGVVFGAGVRVC